MTRLRRLGYHWPSWCRTHRRPHIRVRQCCITNRERRAICRALDELRWWTP